MHRWRSGRGTGARTGLKRSTDGAGTHEDPSLSGQTPGAMQVAPGSFLPAFFFSWTESSFFASKPAPTVDRARLDNSVKCGSEPAREGARRVTPKTAESTHYPPPLITTKQSLRSHAQHLLPWKPGSSTIQAATDHGAAVVHGRLASSQMPRKRRRKRSFRTNYEGFMYTKSAYR